MTVSERRQKMPELLLASMYYQRSNCWAIAYGLDRKVGAERNVLMFYLEVALLMYQSSLLRMEILKSNLQTEIHT